ncbi:hypothetical protein GGR52DRAFT_516027 [Hypoxylon sp. FL1284]|nr:hypothetical protein GGR52DRAFT_516027 [Hypoxylon sp. FL1284]
MKFLATVFVALSIITGSSAWRSFKVIEFESGDCTGLVQHASIGSRPEYWQIKVSNKTTSVYTSTPNDGIYAWYGYASTNDRGCDGDIIRRLYNGCVSLDVDRERIQCLRWCSHWEHDEHSCEAIGRGR